MSNIVDMYMAYMVQLKIQQYNRDFPRGQKKCSALQAIQDHQNWQRTFFQFLLGQLCKFIDLAEFLRLKSVSNILYDIVENAPFTPQYMMSWTIYRVPTIFTLDIIQQCERVNHIIDHTVNTFTYDPFNNRTGYSQICNNYYNNTALSKPLFPNCHTISSVPDFTYYILNPQNIIAECPRLQYFKLSTTNSQMKLLEDSPFIKSITFNSDDYEIDIMKFASTHTLIEKIKLRHNVYNDEIYLRLAKWFPRLKIIHCNHAIIDLKSPNLIEFLKIYPYFEYIKISQYGQLDKIVKYKDEQLIITNLDLNKIKQDAKIEDLKNMI
jgi:hypothetical protein